MDSIFSVLSAAESASQVIRDIQGRSVSLCLGVIANTEDPKGEGKVQVKLATHGGKSLSPWYHRMVPLDNLYPPNYLLGRTAVCGYVEGDPNTGIVLGVLMNAVNRMETPQPKQLNMFVGETGITIDPDEGVTVKVGEGIVLKVTRDTVSINGKDVTVVGAKDSDADTLISKGYSTSI
jgi:hypothetical protein